MISTKIKEKYISVETSKDKLEAYVILHKENITPQEVFFALNSRNIIYGIDEFSVYRACRERSLNKPICVAKGIPPLPGKDAKLKYLFKLDDKPNLFKYSDGSVDYKDLGKIQTVEAGDVLVEKEPIIEGVPGIDVFGNQILPPIPKDVKLPVGKNTKVSEDGLRLIAEKSGYIKFKEGRVDVLTCLEIDKDVDLTTGNIYFVGDIVIKGFVKSGFVVITKGDIEVHQGIEGAELRTCGNIRIYRGIRRNSQVKGKNIYAKFIENSEVEAEEDVIVENVILHSRVDAGKRVILKGTKSKIIGGRIRATEEVLSNTIGSYIEVPTLIQVGVPPWIRQELEDLLKEFQEKRKNYEELKLNLSTLLKLKEENRLSQSKEKLLLEKEKDSYQINLRLIEVNNRIMELKRYILSRRMKGRIHVLSKIYPQVRITIGAKTFTINQEYRNVTLLGSYDTIRTVPYQGQIKI
jgi:uncharacterized protein (DUF342 family)